MRLSTGLATIMAMFIAYACNSEQAPNSTRGSQTVQSSNVEPGTGKGKPDTVVVDASKKDGKCSVVYTKIGDDSGREELSSSAPIYEDTSLTSGKLQPYMSTAPVAGTGLGSTTATAIGPTAPNPASAAPTSTAPVSDGMSRPSLDWTDPDCIAQYPDPTKRPMPLPSGGSTAPTPVDYDVMITAPAPVAE